MLFLWAILLGTGFGLLYDGLRITRIAIPPPRWAISVQDAFFFLCCAAITFFFLMRTLDGQLRFFIILGIIIGMTIYFYTLSILIMGVSELIIRLVKALLRFFCRWFLLPIWRACYFTVRLIIYPVRFLALKAKKYCQRLKYSLKTRRQVLYNQIRSTLTRGKPKKTTAKSQGRKKKTDGKKNAKTKSGKKK